jgi:hypothetical protein
LKEKESIGNPGIGWLELQGERGDKRGEKTPDIVVNNDIAEIGVNVPDVQRNNR